MMNRMQDKIAQRLTGAELAPIFQQPDTPLKLTQNIMDVSKAEKMLSFRADTPLEVGIGHQIEYQRELLEATS